MANVFTRDGKARFFDEDTGEKVWVPVKDAQSAYDRGLRPVGEKEFKVAEEERQFDKPVTSALLGALGGATFGLSDAAIEAVNPSWYHKLRKHNELSGYLGEAVGMLAQPWALGKAATALKGLGGAAKLGEAAEAARLSEGAGALSKVASKGEGFYTRPAGEMSNARLQELKDILDGKRAMPSAPKELPASPSGPVRPTSGPGLGGRPGPAADTKFDFSDRPLVTPKATEITPAAPRVAPTKASPLAPIGDIKKVDDIALAQGMGAKDYTDLLYKMQMTPASELDKSLDLVGQYRSYDVRDPYTGGFQPKSPAVIEAQQEVGKQFLLEKLRNNLLGLEKDVPSMAPDRVLRGGNELGDWLLHAPHDQYMAWKNAKDLQLANEIAASGKYDLMPQAFVYGNKEEALRAGAKLQGLTSEELMEMAKAGELDSLPKAGLHEGVVIQYDRDRAAEKALEKGVSSSQPFGDVHKAIAHEFDVKAKEGDNLAELMDLLREGENSSIARDSIGSSIKTGGGAPSTIDPLKTVPAEVPSAILEELRGLPAMDSQAYKNLGELGTEITSNPGNTLRSFYSKGPLRGAIEREARRTAQDDALRALKLSNQGSSPSERLINAIRGDVEELGAPGRFPLRPVPEKVGSPALELRRLVEAAQPRNRFPLRTVPESVGSPASEIRRLVKANSPSLLERFATEEEGALKLDKVSTALRKLLGIERPGKAVGREVVGKEIIPRAIERGITGPVPMGSAKWEEGSALRQALEAARRGPTAATLTPIEEAQALARAQAKLGITAAEEVSPKAIQLGDARSAEEIANEVAGEGGRKAAIDNLLRRFIEEDEGALRVRNIKDALRRIFTKEVPAPQPIEAATQSGWGKAMEAVRAGQERKALAEAGAAEEAGWADALSRAKRREEASETLSIEDEARRRLEGGQSLEELRNGASDRYHKYIDETSRGFRNLGNPPREFWAPGPESPNPRGAAERLVAAMEEARGEHALSEPVVRTIRRAIDSHVRDFRGEANDTPSLLRRLIDDESGSLNVGNIGEAGARAGTSIKDALGGLMPSMPSMPAGIPQGLGTALDSGLGQGALMGAGAELRNEAATGNYSLGNIVQGAAAGALLAGLSDLTIGALSKGGKALMGNKTVTQWVGKKMGLTEKELNNLIDPAHIQKAEAAEALAEEAAHRTNKQATVQLPENMTKRSADILEKKPLITREEFKQFHKDQMASDNNMTLNERAILDDMFFNTPETDNYLSALFDAAKAREAYKEIVAARAEAAAKLQGNSVGNLPLGKINANLLTGGAGWALGGPIGGIVMSQLPLMAAKQFLKLKAMGPAGDALIHGIMQGVTGVGRAGSVYLGSKEHQTMEKNLKDAPIELITEGTKRGLARAGLDSAAQKAAVEDIKKQHDMLINASGNRKLLSIVNQFAKDPRKVLVSLRDRVHPREVMYYLNYVSPDLASKIRAQAVTSLKDTKGIAPATVKWLRVLAQTPQDTQAIQSLLYPQKKQQAQPAQLQSLKSLGSGSEAGTL